MPSYEDLERESIQDESGVSQEARERAKLQIEDLMKQQAKLPRLTPEVVMRVRQNSVAEMILKEKMKKGPK